MPKTISAFTSPVSGDSPNIALIKANDDTLRAFANDHDASHWPFLLSAPVASDFTFTPTTGGSLTVSQTKYFVLTFITPNGESRASAEMSVALNGSQNAFSFQVAAVDAGFTARLGIYLALAGASPGATKYECRQADISVSGTDASVNADGEVILSTSGTTTITVLAHPPNTRPTAPSTNGTNGQDPLMTNLLALPLSVSITDNSPTSTNFTVTKTYAIGSTTVIETGVYDKSNNNRLLTSGGHSLKIGGLTVARWSYTYATHPVTGLPYCSARTQVEA